MSYIFVFVSIQHPFFNIFEGSPSYVQTHSSCGESPTLWKKHIQLLISAHSLHYHGHMNMTTCSHTSLYTHNRSMQACRLGGGGGSGGSDEPHARRRRSDVLATPRFLRIVLGHPTKKKEPPPPTHTHTLQDQATGLQWVQGSNNNVDHFEYYLPTLRVTVVVFPCQEHV